MENYLRKNFELEPKGPSEEAQMRWRSAVSIVKNRRRRFRMVADLEKRAQAEEKRKKLQVCSFTVSDLTLISIYRLFVRSCIVVWCYSLR